MELFVVLLFQANCVIEGVNDPTAIAPELEDTEEGWEQWDLLEAIK